jgi:hypothetical protein
MPWTRRKSALVAGGAIVGTGIVIASLVMLTVPINQEQSGYTSINHQLYSLDSVTVFGPHWSNFTYGGVLFEFVVWCNAPSLAGAQLCGNASRSVGPVYSFTFWEEGGAPRLSPGPWETWVSPDGHEAVQFESQSGGLAHLLVAV